MEQNNFKEIKLVTYRIIPDNFSGKFYIEGCHQNGYFEFGPFNTKKHLLLKVIEEFSNHGFGLTLDSIQGLLELTNCGYNDLNPLNLLLEDYSESIKNYYGLLI